MFTRGKFAKGILAGIMSLGLLMGTVLSAGAYDKDFDFDGFDFDFESYTVGDEGSIVIGKFTDLDKERIEQLKDNPLVITQAKLGLPSIVENEQTLTAAESAALTTLSINLHCGEVKLSKSKDNSVHITQKGYVKHSSAPLAYSIKNGTLEIKDSRDIKMFDIGTRKTAFFRTVPSMGTDSYVKLDSKEHLDQYIAYLKENIISLEIALPSKVYNSVILGASKSTNVAINNNWKNQLVKGAATYYIDNQSIKNLTSSTVQGEVIATNCQIVSNSMSTVNGTVKLTGGKSDDLNMSSVNGEVMVENCSIRKADLSTVNGDINLKNSPVSQSCSMSAVNGELIGEFAEFPSTSNFSVVNGDIELSFPENSGFYITAPRHDDVDSDFPLTKQGANMVYGDGSRKLQASLVNGDIKLIRTK